MANAGEVRQWKAGHNETCPRCENAEVTRPLATSGALPREWWCPVTLGGCGNRWQRKSPAPAARKETK